MVFNYVVVSQLASAEIPRLVWIFFVKNLRIQKFFVMEDQNHCDHFPIALQFEKNSKIVYRKLVFVTPVFFKSLNRISSFIENLSKSLTTIRYQETESINCAFDRFENTFKEVVAMFAPYRRSSSNTIRKPKWFDENLKNLICKKNQ